VHKEIIFEGPVMILCKKNIPNGILGKGALERELMMRVDSRFSEI
jgi:hypothetical protein